METKTKSILFTDLDGTLIETISGEDHPKGVWDVKIKFDVWDKIKEQFPNLTHIFIVTNQGGIETGKTNPEHFRSKLEWIGDCMDEYWNSSVSIDGRACPSHNDNDSFRKPNTGMFKSLCEQYNMNDKTQMIMLGDASGKEGNFSDGDRKAAENFGIDYIDVTELLNL